MCRSFPLLWTWEKQKPSCNHVQLDNDVSLVAAAAGWGVKESAAPTPTLKDGIIWLWEMQTVPTTSFKLNNISSIVPLDFHFYFLSCKTVYPAINLIAVAYKIGIRAADQHQVSLNTHYRVFPFAGRAWHSCFAHWVVSPFFSDMLVILLGLRDENGNHETSVKHVAIDSWANFGEMGIRWCFIMCSLNNLCFYSNSSVSSLCRS